MPSIPIGERVVVRGDMYEKKYFKYEKPKQKIHRRGIPDLGILLEDVDQVGKLHMRITDNLNTNSRVYKINIDINDEKNSNFITMLKSIGGFLSPIIKERKEEIERESREALIKLCEQEDCDSCRNNESDYCDDCEDYHHYDPIEECEEYYEDRDM